MSPASTLVLAAFAAGVLLAALLAAWMSSRAVGAARLEGAEALAAARAAAAHEGERRLELEGRLEELRHEAAELDRRATLAEERLARSLELAGEQRTFLETARRDLEASFRGLAAEALRSSGDQFLTLAEQRLARSRGEAAAELDQRHSAMAALLAPLLDTLGRLENRTGELERARVAAYSRIDQQVRLLAEATAGLDEKATSLVTALRGSAVRGRWGEVALRNIVELAGMTAHCDFEEQAGTGEGRPDMIVRLPGERAIAVDAKAPLGSYLEATEAGAEGEQAAVLERYARALRGHVRALAGRDYAAAVGGGVDLVVLFLPSDSYLAAAFARDPALMVDALRDKVLLATPTTLLALLRTVAIYWQQQSLASNAAAIAATARELYERAAKFALELDGVGRGLRAAVEAFNRAVGTFDRRLVPMARRLEEMKVAEQTRRDFEAPQPIDDAVRVPGPPDDPVP